MTTRLITILLFTLAAFGLFYFDIHGRWKVELVKGYPLWQFLAAVGVILLLQQLAVSLIRVLVHWRGGTEGESKMLSGLVGTLTWLTVIASFLYCVGVLKTVGVVAAGFVGMLLGWSLQAPASGMVAWIMITLKRPFRVGDRVNFPSLGLNGDVKQVGMMYTVLDQVGGAIGSEDAVGRDILIPNAMLFNQVAINYTPKAEAMYFLDEVVIRMTYDSDWDRAEKILLDTANKVTAEVVKATGQKPYIRSDMWDYGILLRLRYMTMAKDRPRITHEIVKDIFKAVQKDPKVDIAIPFVYSYRRSTTGPAREVNSRHAGEVQEILVGEIDSDEVLEKAFAEHTAESDTLARNIREQGLLQPLIVERNSNGRYRIVVGHKRFLTCKRLGWKTVPAIVQPKHMPS